MDARHKVEENYEVKGFILINKHLKIWSTEFKKSKGRFYVNSNVENVSTFAGETHIEFCCHLARGNMDPKEPPVYEYVKFVGDFKFHNHGKKISFKKNYK